MDTLNAEAGEEVFGFCFDVGHAVLTGANLYQYLVTMGKRITVLHIQDNNGMSDGHMLPFTQEHDWTAIMAALKQQKFCGPMNLEIISFMERMPEALIPDALAFSAKVGRYLMARLEE